MLVLALTLLVLCNIKKVLVRPQVRMHANKFS